MGRCCGPLSRGQLGTAVTVVQAVEGNLSERASLYRPAIAKAALPLLVLGASALRAEIIDIAWTASGEFARTVSVAPGKFVEICAPLEYGQSVHWTFEANQPLDFNVHYHVGKDVVYPAKQDGARNASGTVHVALRETYCWMWRSRQQALAEVRVRLNK